MWCHMMSCDVTHVMWCLWCHTVSHGTYRQRWDFTCLRKKVLSSAIFSTMTCMPLVSFAMAWSRSISQAPQPTQAIGTGWGRPHSRQPTGPNPHGCSNHGLRRKRGSPFLRCGTCCSKKGGTNNPLTVKADTIWCSCINRHMTRLMRQAM